MPQRKAHKKKEVDLRKNLEWLMFFRVTVISLLLGVSVAFKYTNLGSLLVVELIYIYILIGFTYFLTAIYIPLIRKIKNLTLFAYIQFAADIVMITYLVYITGAIDSVFTFLYLPSIIAASIFLYRTGGFLTASMSSILYGVMIDLDYYHIVSLPGSGSTLLYNESYIFYNIFINIVAFFLVAFLSGYFALQLQKAGADLIEKEIDYEELKILNNDIIQNIQTGLVTINTDNLVISCNRQAETITGMTLKEVYMKPIDEVIPGIMVDIARFEAGMKHGPFNRWTMDFVSRDGKKYILGFSVSHLQNSKRETMGEIILFQDITMIKEMEDEIKRSDRLATLGALAANLAHEIRNPLASMSGSIQLLKNELKLDGQNKNLMEIVLQEINRLNHLITDFLLYARPPEINKRPIDLVDVINETIAMFKNTPMGEGRIVIDASFNGDTKIKGDFMQLKQILWNILLNSADAMKGGGTIRIVVSEETDLLDRGVVIRIIDNGSGIEDEKLALVFEPFFSTKEGGTGLGLATVRQIVEAHGGNVSIISEMGKGSEVFITLSRN